MIRCAAETMIVSNSKGIKVEYIRKDDMGQ